MDSFESTKTATIHRAIDAAVRCIHAHDVEAALVILDLCKLLEGDAFEVELLTEEDAVDES